MEHNQNEERKDLPESEAVPFEDPVPEQAPIEQAAEAPAENAPEAVDPSAASQELMAAEAPDVPDPKAEKAAAKANAKAAKEAKRAAKEAEKAEKERQKAEANAAKHAKKEEEQVSKDASAEAAPAPRPNAQKRYNRRVRTHPRSYWIRRGRRRYLRRTTGRVFRFVVAMLLGIAIAFGSLAAGAFFAVGGLTIDTLQRFGMAQDIDQYLTDRGEIDLTATSILELVNDLNAVRGDLGAHTLQSLIDRYGIALPEQVLKIMPTDLFDVPLDQLLSDEAGNVVTQNLTVGYILQFLPQSLLHPQAIAVLSPRPLALLTNGDFGALLEGVQLGHVTGVTYDEQGNVQYLNPECPTMQEAMAKLDLGKVVNAVTKNGDMLAVIATDLGETDLGPVVSGMISGTFVEQMFTGRLVKNVILLNEQTGRYEFSLPALTDGLVLGDAMNYIRVDGVWYTTYTDNDDPTDDVEISAMQKALADIPLTDIVNGNLSIEQEFAGLYFGDLQNGYVRGEAITEVPEGETEPVTVGYEWSKDGEPVGKLQAKLANIEVTTVLEGGLDINTVLGGLYLGDLQGYIYREITDGTSTEVIGHKWYKKGEDGTETEVNAMMSAIADIALSDVLNGELDLASVFGTLKLGDAQSYVLGEDGLWYREVDDGAGGTKLEYVGAVQNSISNVLLSDVINGNFDLATALNGLRLGDAMGYTYRTEDSKWYREVDDGAGGTKLEYVGAVQSSISNVPLSDVVNGNFSLTTALGDLYLGDAMGYERGDAITEVPDGGTEPVVVGYEWTKDNGTPEGEAVSGTMREFANIPLTDVIEGRVNVEETMKEMTLAEALGYKQVGGTWYEEYTDAENNKPVKGILRVLAGKKIKELNSTTIDTTKLGDVLDFTYRDTNDDGEGDTWYDGDAPATGVLAKLADLTVGDLSNGETVTAKIKELTLAEAMGYTKVGDTWYSVYSDDDDPTNDVALTGILSVLADKPLKDINADTVSTEIRKLTLAEAMGYTKVGGVWYSTYKGENHADNVKITGILAVLAEMPLGEINAATIDGIVLGTALGYEQRDTDADGTPDTWYDKNGNKVEGIIGEMADLKIGELSDNGLVSEKINAVKVSEILDYTYDTTDKRWEHPNGTPASGVIAHMLDIDVTIGGMEGAIDDMQLGYALGLHQKDGEWLDENDQPPTGVFAGLADIHLSNASTEIRSLQIGRLMGYTDKDTDEDGKIDTWYYDNDDTTNDPVTGLTKSFAGLLVTELGDESKIASAMQSAKLGDSLGFKNVDGTWYKTKLDADNHTVADLENPVTGLIGALADKEIGDIESEVQSVAIGDMLDYTLVGSTWYEEYTDNGDSTDDKPAKGVLAVLADSNLSNLSTNLNGLKVNDIWPASERTGILSLLTGEEKITELNAAVSSVFSNAKMGEFLTAGVITISQSQQDVLDSKPVFDGWRNMKFVDFFGALIAAATGTE